MPKPYGVTKKGELEQHIKFLELCVLPTTTTLAKVIGCKPATVLAALKEWNSNNRLVIKVNKDWLKRGYCPDCWVENHDIPDKSFELINYHVFPTQWEGILVFAKCPVCKIKVVSRNSGEYEESAI